MLRTVLTSATAILFLFASACSSAEPATTIPGWKIKGDEQKSKWKIGTATLDESNPSKVAYKAEGTELVNTDSGSMNLYTDGTYGDVLVEIEVMVPKGSNSGVYLMGEYEIQVLDSFGKEKVGPGDMGGIYSTAAPKVNASKKSGEWQKFVIDFQAPKFENGKKVKNGVFIKVTLNDVVIHENVEVTKSTGSGFIGKEVETGPVMLQGDHGPVAFRNFKITAKK